VTGAALRMTWHQFFVAGAILKKSLDFGQMDLKNCKNALERGRQLRAQLSIFKGHLAELLRF